MDLLPDFCLQLSDYNYVIIMILHRSPDLNLAQGKAISLPRKQIWQTNPKSKYCCHQESQILLLWQYYEGLILNVMNFIYLQSFRSFIE